MMMNKSFLPLKMANSYIGPRIYRNFEFLKRISKIKSEKKRENILRQASREELLAVIEIALNILRFNFRLGERQRKKLIPFAPYLRQLAAVRSERGARRIINQKGSGPVLAALVLPVVAELARVLIDHFSKKKNGG
jgi:hypothetical protein